MRGQAPALLMTMAILLMTMTTQVLLVLREEEEEADNQGYLLHHLLRNIGKIIITWLTMTIKKITKEMWGVGLLGQRQNWITRKGWDRLSLILGDSHTRIGNLRKLTFYSNITRLNVLTITSKSSRGCHQSSHHNNNRNPIPYSYKQTKTSRIVHRISANLLKLTKWLKRWVRGLQSPQIRRSANL